MQSFASELVTYVDGQLSREAVPAEIIAKGFKPPVLLPDGSIEDGDHLSANHLNYILNDIYAQLASAKVAVSRTGTNLSGSVTYSDGSIDAWGVVNTVSAAGATLGTGTVTYPVKLPEASRDIRLTVTGNTAGMVTAKVDLANITASGFSLRTDGPSGAVSATVLWRVSYHGGF